MIRMYTLSRDALKAKKYKQAKRTVTGEKLTIRDTKMIANIIRKLPK